MTTPKSVQCRQITTGDVEPVVALLTVGFRAQRGRAFWERALARLGARDVPAGLPRFGYLLETDGIVVGVILLIFSAVARDGITELRCNLSSWYVAEGYRLYGPMLISRALRHREATYSNLTPAPHTEPILQAQGFQRSCAGRFIAIPVFSRAREACDIIAFAPGSPEARRLSPGEADLLADHAADGCLSIVGCMGGEVHPFVFAPRRKYGLLGMALLSYCRDIGDFVRFAGPIGRFLLRRGFPLASIDANGPIAGLAGRYDGTKPKYFRGANPPRLGDTLYTERTMFGS